MTCLDFNSTVLRKIVERMPHYTVLRPLFPFGRRSGIPLLQPTASRRLFFTPSRVRLDPK